MTSTHSTRLQGDGGDTLVEILCAILIIGTAIAALLGGLATGVLGSAQHRQQATANAVLRSYAEALKQTTRTGYLNCAAAYTVPGGFTLPAGWVAPTNSVAAQASCPGADSGTQRVTVTVTSPTNHVETLTLVVRKP